MRRLGAFYCMTGTGQYDNLCRFLMQAAGLEEVLIGEPELDG
ncbi:MAG: hypothetical protein O7G87_04015 [bacterium]|nr:hypothetical protein [bacterium]